MAARPATILRRLRSAYGEIKAPRKRPPLDELILTILSQNTSDTNRDRAWKSLRARFKTWDQVADARARSIQEAIRVGGLAATKAPRIKAVLRAIREHRGRIDLSFLRRASDEEVRTFLAALPGVGPKTIACVLAFSLGRAAIPVDTHVHRLGIRLGLIPPKMSAAAAHAELQRIVAPIDRLPLHVALITHGRRTCRAGRPLCAQCVLADLCPKIGVDQGRQMSPSAISRTLPAGSSK